MRTGSRLRRVARNLIPVTALGAVALTAGAAPAQASGAAVRVSPEVPLSCALDLDGFKLSNLAATLTIDMQVPTYATRGETFVPEDASFEIELSPLANASFMYADTDSVTPWLDDVQVDLVNATEQQLRLNPDPLKAEPHNVGERVATTIRVPSTGTVPQLAPITVQGGPVAADLRSIDMLFAVRTDGTVGSQYDLPFSCSPAAQDDRRLFEITDDIIEGWAPDAWEVTPSGFVHGEMESVILDGDYLDLTSEVTINGTPTQFEHLPNERLRIDVAHLQPGEHIITVSDGWDPDPTPVLLTVLPVPPTEPASGIELTCKMDLGGLVLNNLAATVRVSSTLPAHVRPGGHFDLADAVVEVDLPPNELATPGDPLPIGEISRLDVSATNTISSVTNLFSEPTAFSATLAPGQSDQTVRAPGEGTLPHVPFTVKPTARAGDYVDFLVERLVLSLAPDAAFLDHRYELDCLPTGGNPQISSVVVAGGPVVPDANTASPASVAAGQAAQVVLSGSGLTTVNSVKVGGQNTTFQVNRNGTVTVNVPAQAQPGSVPVVVSSRSGADGTPVTLQVSDASAGGPVVKRVKPDNVPVPGGQVVIVTGDDLATATRVTVSGVDAPFLKLGRSLLVTLPFLGAGEQDLVVSSATGSSRAVTVTYTEVHAQ